jgi:transcriptional regulator with XRE-family HTH domain
VSRGRIVSRVDGNRIRLYAAIGETVRAKRVGGKFTLEALSRATKISKSQLAKVEEGLTSCPAHVLVALADAFDCTLDDLVPVLTVESEAAA